MRYMKNSVLYTICVILLASCGGDVQKKCVLDQYPVEQCVLDVHSLDSGLVAPQSVNVFQDKLLIMETQKPVSKLSVFDRNSFGFLCSGIDEGRANNEVIYLRADYYAHTDTSFFVLANNIEKEYAIKDNHIQYLSSTSIDIPDALNQLLRVGTEKYIASGFTSGEGNEHLLYENGQYKGFGEYPEIYADTKNFVLNGKTSAGMVGKDRIWDFYMNHNLIRSYDLDGNLLEEIEIENAAQKTKIANPEDSEFYFYRAKWNADYIAVLYNEKCSWLEFYTPEEAEQRIHELQLWTWDGELKRRIRFDRHFDFYTLSEDNVFYAMDAEQPDIVYTYNLNGE